MSPVRKGVRHMSDSKTTNEADEAFLRICEALGIQASALAYLEVPTILRAAKARGENRVREGVTNAKHNETTDPSLIEPCGCGQDTIEGCAKHPFHHCGNYDRAAEVEQLRAELLRLTPRHDPKRQT